MSWWNPVDDVKSAAKDAKHAVSDAVHTGKSLAADAYKTAKDGVKGVVKTGIDAVRTGITVSSDVAQGHYSLSMQISRFPDGETVLARVHLTSGGGGEIIMLPNLLVNAPVRPSSGSVSWL
jgi:hypothetical protein